MTVDTRVHPTLMRLWGLLEIAMYPIEIKITSGLRTLEEQAELYAQGRTKPGNKVTNAKPGQTPHNFGMAIDIAPVVDGKVPWNDTKLWKKLVSEAKRIATDIGADLAFGADFKANPDSPHIEIREWRREQLCVHNQPCFAPDLHEIGLPIGQVQPQKRTKK